MTAEAEDLRVADERADILVRRNDELQERVRLLLLENAGLKEGLEVARAELEKLKGDR